MPSSNPIKIHSMLRLPVLMWVSGMICLVALGFWQLNRAAYKQTLRHDWQMRQSLPAIEWPSQAAVANLADGTRLRLQGEYQNDQQLWLDNRVYQGQVGVDVITPFLLDSGDLVLVNRGFVPWPWPRQDVPMIAPVLGHQQILVSVKLLQNPWVLQAQDYQKVSWPLLIQRIEPNLLAPLFSAPLSAITVRLAADEPHGFIRDWPLTSITPARHYAYAVQWFALALCAAVIGIRAKRRAVLGE